MAHDSQYYITLVTPVIPLLIVSLGAAIHAARVKKRGGSALDTWMKWWLIGGVFMSTVVFWSSFVFAPGYMAKTLGFTQSPFEFEIAFANLGYGIMALLAVSRPVLRKSVGIGYGVFLFGATYGHLYQQFAKHNTHAGNTGGILVADIAIPVVLVALARAQERRAQLSTAA